MKFHRVYYKEFSRTDKISIDNKSKINHLKNVLRLSEGSKVDVFDGKGNSSICKIVSLEKKKIVLEQIGDTKFQQPERINLKVLMPYIKKENLFLAITGPESGFSKQEREFLDAITSHNISLGKNILRAETAPITALSVIKSNLGLL